MAISSAICNSFKVEILTGTHNFTTTTGDDFNLALYTSGATLDKDTTVYSTNPGGGADTEVATATGYTAKGKEITSVTPVLSSDTAVCDFANVSWTSASFTANGCLIFNDDAGDKAVCTIAFGGDKTVTSGTFTIEFPAAAAGTAIIGIA